MIVTYTVYQIINKDNGRVYFGCTKDYRFRKLTHEMRLKGGNHPNLKLLNDYRKGHKMTFKIILRTRNCTMARILESVLILDLPCYNVTNNRNRNKFSVTELLLKFKAQHETKS